MSWCSARPSVLSETGISIHPTIHLSSSTTSAVGDLGDGVEMEICEDCAGIRYCAYDHSESKYFGSGKKGVNVENVDWRLDAPDEVSANTCTVPLSLQTHNSLSSGRNATPYISALSVPLRNSRTSFPV